MKFKRLILFFFGFLALNSSNAQCTVDYLYSPSGANYGLSPDTLPDGVQGQIYNQDLTFFLPLDTTDSGLTVTFTDFHITSINLPLGLTWQCSNFSNGCHYDPSVDQYGCVNISGVPLQAGVYNVDVTLVATHNLSNLAGTVPVSFSLPLNILPDTSSSNNAGFAMIGGAGCSPIQVSFSNNNPGMNSYMWDFGNGTMSMAENPAPQIYNIPGTYVVNYQAYSSTVSSYFLTNIEVVDADGWDGDVEDGFGLLSPDPYIIVKDQGGNTIFTSSVYIDTDFPVSWSINNIPLQNQTYTIEVWDEDGPVTNDDFCGSLTFPGFSNSGTIMGGGEIINYSILEVLPTPMYSETDTIFVHSYPSQANIVYDTLNTILHTDSSYFGLQWYYYNSPIPNATDSVFVPLLSGLYSLVAINQFGCTSISDDVLVVICDSTYQPTLQANGMDIWMVDSALYSDFHWQENGNLIPGALGPEYIVNNTGMYSIVAVDTFGCAYISDDILICNNNQQPMLGVNGMNLWVADSSDYTVFYWMESGGSLANTTSSHEAIYTGLYSVQTEDTYGCQYTSAEMLICNENFIPSINSIGNVAWISDSIGYSIQWYLDGNILVNEIDPTIVMNNTGDYSAMLIDVYGCSYLSGVVSNTNTFISDVFTENQIYIYPNPVEDFISIVNLNNDCPYQIIDLKGSLIQDGFTIDDKIDLNDLEDGFYFITILLKDSVFTEKILKF